MTRNIETIGDIEAVGGHSPILPDILPDIELDVPADARAQTRIVVAMSGGVDSSVAAALVKKAGYETIGITLQLYDNGAASGRKGACCAGQDIHDARRVAAALDMPHYVLDYEGRFRASVMDDFAETYISGHTPIPCVRCNETVKFHDLLAMAKNLGAAALVTGHYIETRRGAKGWEMYRPTDEARDQSYFLFSTTKAQLDFLRFPLARFNKNEIRQFASALGLITADKPDSQDICFVPNGDYASVIKKLRPESALAGEIVDMDGQVLGTHQGIIHYTIGQRRGLGLSGGAPLYVIRIDAERRQVVVGPREALAVAECELAHVNWLGDDICEASGAERAGAEKAGEGIDILARIRSTTPPRPARLMLASDNTANVRLTTPEEGVSPGQACVFYDMAGCRVLGGGFITHTHASAGLAKA